MSVAGSLGAMAYEDGSVHVIELTQARLHPFILCACMHVHTGHILSCAFEFWCAARAEWGDCMQGRALRTFPPMSGPVASLMLSPTHHLLLATGRCMLQCDLTHLSCSLDAITA